MQEEFIIKTIKQHSLKLPEEHFKALKEEQEIYKQIKAFCYHNLRNISYINKLNFRKIRKAWKKKEFKQWNCNAHLKDMALQDAISQIDSKHSNVKIKIRKLSNKIHDKQETHYINFVLKNKDLLFNVLNNINITDDKFGKNKDKFSCLNLIKLNSYIKRTFRKYNTKLISKSNRSMNFDITMYSAKKGLISLASLTKRKPIKVKLKDNKWKPTGNIKVILNHEEKSIEIHFPIKTKIKENTNENIIGIDKGYNDLLVTSTGNIYGEKSSNIVKIKSDYITDKYRKRNKTFQIAKLYKEKGELKKYNNIINNNLGNKKIKKEKNKLREIEKSNINYSINQMLLHEKPAQLILENLNFTSKNKGFGKKINRYLSSWTKGYLQDRLEYKTKQNDIEIKLVNPAYTSQVCSICMSFGKRNGADFTCESHGTVNADINASKNVLIRGFTGLITLYTPYKSVKNILNRLARSYASYSVSTKTNKLDLLSFIGANYS